MLKNITCRLARRVTKSRSFSAICAVATKPFCFLCFVLCLAPSLTAAGRTQTLQQTAPPPEPVLSSDTILVDQNQHGCRAGGKDYTTALDCAFAKALRYTASSHHPVEIRLTEGTFDTARGLQMSSDVVQSVSIVGAGKGEFGGGGTVLRLISPIAQAVIYYPYLNSTQTAGFWSNLHLQGFTVDANALAPGCLDLEALRVAHLEDLSCTGATGEEAWVRIGALPKQSGGVVPDGYNGASFQVIASDLFVYHNGMAPEAEIKADLSHGSVQHYEVLHPGQFRESGQVPVLLKRTFGGKAPCRVMPQGLSGQVVADAQHPEFYRLAGVSQLSGGEGCSDDLGVIAVDMPAARYGFEIFATDSSFYDLTDDSLGREAGISDRGSGGTTFVHAHVWNTWGGLELWGDESVISPELDSEYGYGIRFRWGKGSAVLNPTFVYLRHPAYNDMVEYLFDPDATDMTIAQEACGLVDPNPGHMQFAWVDRPTGLEYGALTGSDFHQGYPLALPHGLHTSGLSFCSDRQASEKAVQVHSKSLAEAGSERRLFWTATHVTNRPVSFLVAEFPSDRQPPSLPSLRVTTEVSTARGTLAEQVFHIAVPGTIPGVAICSQQATKPGLIEISTDASDMHRTKVYLTVRSGASISVLVDMVTDPEIYLEPPVAVRLPAGALPCR